MSQDWLTIHWPHPLERHHPWNVYLRESNDAAALGRQLAVGDSVFFYETRSGKDEVGKPLLPWGRSGIVAVGTVTAPIVRRVVKIQHTDGKCSTWGWEVPCGGHDTDGFCACRDAAVAIGYSERYNFHGYGGGLGLRRIDADAASHLLACFKAGKPRATKPRKVRGRSTQPRERPPH